MKKKVYYNLTQIDNGWLLSYPRYLAGKSTVAVGTTETYYPVIKDVFEFIDKHFRDQSEE